MRYYPNPEHGPSGNRTAFPVRVSSRHLACGPRGRAVKGQCGRTTARPGATFPRPIPARRGFGRLARRGGGDATWTPYVSASVRGRS